MSAAPPSRRGAGEAPGVEKLMFLQNWLSEAVPRAGAAHGWPMEALGGTMGGHGQCIGTHGAALGCPLGAFGVPRGAHGIPLEAHEGPLGTHGGAIGSPRCLILYITCVHPINRPRRPLLLDYIIILLDYYNIIL